MWWLLLIDYFIRLRDTQGILKYISEHLLSRDRKDLAIGCTESGLTTDWTRWRKRRKRVYEDVFSASCLPGYTLLSFTMPSLSWWTEIFEITIKVHVYSSYCFIMYFVIVCVVWKMHLITFRYIRWKYDIGSVSHKLFHYNKLLYTVVTKLMYWHKWIRILRGQKKF